MKITIHYLLSTFFYAIHSFIQDQVFRAFLFFYCIIMYILNILSTIKKMTIKKTQKYLIFENYYRQIVFTKENSYSAMKHQKKKDLLLFTTKLTTTTTKNT